MAINFFRKDKSMSVSLPKAQTVHGIEVKKAPIGQYLAAMREMEELPLQLIRDLFPGKTLTEIIAEFTTFTDDNLAELFVRILIVVPEKLIKVFVAITGIHEERIMDLTPKEGVDVFKAWWALNDMTGFFADAAGLIKKLLPPIRGIGSSAGSQSERS
jgi:hypothetical protein